MIYTIFITTYREERFTEKIYGFGDATKRVAELTHCDNIQAIDVVNNETGELIFMYKDGEVL